MSNRIENRIIHKKGIIIINKREDLCREGILSLINTIPHLKMINKERRSEK